jgi:hypothetical protein
MQYDFSFPTSHLDSLPDPFFLTDGRPVFRLLTDMMHYPVILCKYGDERLSVTEVFHDHTG